MFIVVDENRIKVNEKLRVVNKRSSFLVLDIRLIIKKFLFYFGYFIVFLSLRIGVFCWFNFCFIEGKIGDRMNKVVELVVRFMF